MSRRPIVVRDPVVGRVCADRPAHGDLRESPSGGTEWAPSVLDLPDDWNRTAGVHGDEFADDSRDSLLVGNEVLLSQSLPFLPLGCFPSSRRGLSGEPVGSRLAILRIEYVMATSRNWSANAVDDLLADDQHSVAPVQVDPDGDDTRPLAPRTSHSDKVISRLRGSLGVEVAQASDRRGLDRVHGPSGRSLRARRDVYEAVPDSSSDRA